MTKINEAVVENTAKRCRERGVLIPTFSQQMHPELVPQKVKSKLPGIGLWDLNPLNLFRISWKNDVKTGLYGDVNVVEIPRELTGVNARIVGMVGKYFPTGAHKVGAAFGCLVPRLVTGEFDPSTQKAVWPSTGNYCRGGAFDCALLDTTAVAILPEGMSKERFEWLKEIGAEVIATPGCESNVKEIYDKCWDIKKNRKDCVIFNQFEEFGNSAWHYHVTGNAAEEAFKKVKGTNGRLAGYVSATGSAGTISAGDYLRKIYPSVRVAATEALQCPTLLSNGFGDHRIEGIGDKHIPWVHNVRNTNAVIAIDDESTMRILRLFNEEAGRKVLAQNGISPRVIELLPLLGISGICNLLASIKMAKYFEFDQDDVIITMFTDSAEMYQSRLLELAYSHGPYGEIQAAIDLERYLRGVGTDNMKELGYQDQKALHNLKYFTWVEQQGKTAEELRQLWSPSFWDEKFSQMNEWDSLIEKFNERTGVLKNL
ncbi:MAG TPA: pyridoxal-5-phosphate-dependent protein subunit beta [Bdellovibrionales bacterium]|nr:MAG: pyridoxal-5-phosphate-dependent protein subunit beta [Bdellovibrionales bacterium GWA1_52_35]OFZ43530.1 MAG: pyridoxal-5-phosphate-dependent protein subunit beta [Bdellovibrionales bacterium GWC1_52_8]HAR43960.1 pyridoxal-5-phosphate-dependent protein subunit beta [Bdellovibrionales bacterium]HCM40876.1 pyridoxal-5-phosphate-dependent protein subunit beta [Bdellovibrionales bacterium]